MSAPTLAPSGLLANCVPEGLGEIKTALGRVAAGHAATRLQTALWEHEHHTVWQRLDSFLCFATESRLSYPSGFHRKRGKDKERNALQSHSW